MKAVLAELYNVLVMDKLAGTLMMIGGLALGFISIPPVSLVALVAMIAGALLFIGGIEVMRNPSTRNGT